MTSAVLGDTKFRAGHKEIKGKIGRETEGENFLPPTNSAAINQLSLYNFRNYKSLSIAIDKGPIILSGPNGSGKTNILEAISLFGPGKGIKGARAADIIPHNQSQYPENYQGQPSSLLGGAMPQLLWGTSLIFSDDVHFAVGLERNSYGTDKKICKIHHQNVKSPAAFNEWLNIFWLTPETDRIFQDSPSVRRKFIDRLIGAENPFYYEQLNRYEQLLRERLVVLRSGQKISNTDATWLNVLEQQLSCCGVAVAVARQNLMAQFNRGRDYCHPLFPKFYSKMCGAVDELLATKSATEVEEEFQGVLLKNRNLDRESGTTKFGPHRSDWQVYHLGKNLGAEFTSTGEQKILLVAVMLSLIHEKTRFDQRLTILLLDDVIAHLDFYHRVVLFEQILTLQSQTQSQGELTGVVQVWLTGTDSLLFEGLMGKAQFFMVEDATVTSG